MKIKRCGWCKNGMTAMDGETAYTVCALLPPTHILPAPNAEGMQAPVWVRPNMSVKGWCGQFGFSLLRWLGYGARA